MSVHSDDAKLDIVYLFSSTLALHSQNQSSGTLLYNVDISLNDHNLSPWVMSAVTLAIRVWI
jgi:hypothetical protein